MSQNGPVLKVHDKSSREKIQTNSYRRYKCSSSNNGKVVLSVQKHRIWVVVFTFSRTFRSRYRYSAILWRAHTAPHSDQIKDTLLVRGGVGGARLTNTSTQTQHTTSITFAPSAKHKAKQSTRLQAIVDRTPVLVAGVHHHRHGEQAELGERREATLVMYVDVERRVGGLPRDQLLASRTTHQERVRHPQCTLVCVCVSATLEGKFFHFPF